MSFLDRVISQKLDLVIQQLDITDTLITRKPDLKLNKHPEKVIYQTAYCFTLAKSTSKTSLQLANEIAVQLNNEYNNEDDRNQDFTTNVSGEGWLEFSVNKYLIAQYLNKLTQYPVLIKDSFQLKHDRPGAAAIVKLSLSIIIFMLVVVLY